jgi:hypothetical protein
MPVLPSGEAGRAQHEPHTGLRVDIRIVPHGVVRGSAQKWIRFFGQWDRGSDWPAL